MIDEDKKIAQLNDSFYVTLPRYGDSANVVVTPVPSRMYTSLYKIGNLPSCIVDRLATLTLLSYDPNERVWLDGIGDRLSKHTFRVYVPNGDLSWQTPQSPK